MFVVGSLLILTHCSDGGGDGSPRATTYEGVVLLMCGRKVALGAAVAVVLYCFGTCVTFFIVIGDQWHMCT